MARWIPVSAAKPASTPRACPAARRPWRARRPAGPWAARTDRAVADRRGWRGSCPVLSQALADDLLGRAAAQDALAAGVVGGVEARQQALEVAVARDGDAQHLALDPAVEALRHPVRARGVGPGLAVLDAERAAGSLEGVGGEAAAAVGEHVRDTEGEGGERLLQEGPGAGLGLVVFHRQVDRAGAPVDGHEQEPLAQLAVGRAQLG